MNMDLALRRAAREWAKVNYPGDPGKYVEAHQLMLLVANIALKELLDKQVAENRALVEAGRG